MLNFGGFLSSNFWTNYRCSSSASVEDLLSNKECTVDKLLDDDDCLQEFKNYNDKLIKYFDHDKLKVLVDYITVMPELDEQKRGHKYPFISAEIFNCEINQILDKFFEAPVKIKALPPAVAADTTTEATETATEASDAPIETTESSEIKKDEEEESKKEQSTEGSDVEAKKKVDSDKDQKEIDDRADEVKVKEVDDKKDDGEKELVQEKDSNETEKKEEKSVDEDKNEEEVVNVEKPPQDGESKEEVKEESKKEETPETEKPAQKASDATEVPKEQNTQEPESEEPDKENTEVKKADATSEEAKTEVKEEGKSSEEPEGEDTVKEAADKDKLADKDLSTMASQSTLQTEVQEEEEDEEEGNKFILLERLFKFIQTDEELNPVLAGYFCKLVSLLISRKQKQLFPFIFAPESTVIEDLMKHVYQKSISEILNKLLTLVDTDHEPEIFAEIKAKQQMAVGTLIESLGPEKSEEHNLNACTIIQDMFEIKDFYNLICEKENLTKIVDFALAGMDESTKHSKCSSLTVLNQIVLSNIEKQKKKDNKDEDKEQGHDEDDDIIVQQNSDDEKEEDEASNPNSTSAQTALLVDILKQKVGAISTILKADHEGLATIQSSVNEVHNIPLGMQRLYTIELVLRMVQLQKEVLYTAMGRSTIFGNIMVLVQKYPWNNFMQLKVIAMCDEVLENCGDEQFKKDFLESSGIAKSIVAMGAEASFKMNSERLIRNGYMGLVVSVSNKLIKKFKGTASKPEDATVVEYLDNVGEEWRAFVDDELANSNANDNKTLGGSTKPDDGGSADGDDPHNIDDQMEKIMQRFSNFNQMLTSGSNEQDDDDDDGDDAEDATPTTADQPQDDSDSMKVEKISAQVIAPLEKEFIDSSYWSTPTGVVTEDDDIDYDSLYAELDA